MPNGGPEHVENRKKVKFHQIWAKYGKLPYSVEIFALTVIFFDFFNTLTWFYTKIPNFMTYQLENLAD